MVEPLEGKHWTTPFAVAAAYLLRMGNMQRRGCTHGKLKRRVARLPHALFLNCGPGRERVSQSLVFRLTVSVIIRDIYNIFRGVHVFQNSHLFLSFLLRGSSPLVSA